MEKKNRLRLVFSLAINVLVPNENIDDIKISFL